MIAWLWPVVAGAFATGLFAAPAIGDLLTVPVWFAAGLISLGLALYRAPASRRPDLGDLDPTAPALRSIGVGRHRGDLARVVSALAVAVVAVACLGVAWATVHAHRIDHAVLARLVDARVTIDATLRADPARSAFGWSAIADVRLVAAEVGTYAVDESVWVSGDGASPDAGRGDLVRIEGSVAPPPPDDDGFATFLRRRGLAATVEAETVDRLGGSDVPLIRWAQSVRATARSVLGELFPPREAGLLLGLALGDDSRLDPALERDFRASGLSHLLVVSGGNVAMVLVPVIALGALLHLSRWPRFALAAATVVLFVVLTGAEPSVLRAGVMAGITLVGVVAGRPRSTATTLAVTVFVLLVVDPSLVWSLGFQLSVVATAGMLALATPLAGRMSFLPRPIALAAGATLAAQIAVTPLLLTSFHEVPLSALVANVVAFPAVGPAMLLGVAAGATVLVWEPLGRVLAALALAPMRYLETVADRAASAPVPWITGGGAATLVVGLSFATGIAWWLRSRRRLPRSAIVVGVAVLPLAVWATALSSGAPAALTVRFFDVGQGDAALVTSPGGASILVDGGPDEAQVATALAALGVKRLDVVVASHPHADHIVGLPAVLARVPVGLLLRPGCETDSEDAAALELAIVAEGVQVRHPVAGDVLEVGDVEIEILSPDRCWSGTESDTNNDAIVLRVSLGGDSVLLATEPEEPAQQALLDGDADLRADVLKVPHHGAATSIRPFFEAIDPAVAVVSVGPNPYGHPVPEVLGWLRATGAEVVRTDRAGDVTITFRAGLVSVDSAG